jgi:hypothetical protein
MSKDPEALQQIGGLSAPASRLLNVLMILGYRANGRPMKEIMEYANIKDRGNFSRARKELETKGLIVAARADTYRVSSALASATNPFPLIDNDKDSIRSDLSYLSYLSQQEFNRPVERVYKPGAVEATTRGAVETTTNDVLSTTNDVPSTTAVTTTTTAVTTTTNDVSSTTYGTLLDRCEAVDQMDASGPVTSPNSNFAKRRAAQLPLLQEIWHELFPFFGPLDEGNARKYLGWCDNSLMNLHQGMNTLVQRAKEPVRKPVRFMDISLPGWVQKEMGKQPAPAQRPTSSAPAQQPPKMSAKEQIVKGDVITNDELIHVSDEERARMRAFSKEMESLF